MQGGVRGQTMVPVVHTVIKTARDSVPQVTLVRIALELISME